MPKKLNGTKVALTLDQDLVDRVDAYAARLATDFPGLAVSRNKALRVLITAGLNANETVLRRLDKKGRMV